MINLEENIFIKSYILTLDSLYKYINILSERALASNFDSKRFPKKHIIGYTNFNYPIYSITIGNGKNDVVLLGGTHGCEVATVYFMLEFLATLLLDTKIKADIFNTYSFHIIPVLNPEGFKISSSILYENFKNKTIKELELSSLKYVRAYAQDDENAIKQYKVPKLYQEVLKSSTSFIDDKKMRESIIKILNDCNLTEKVLPIWSSNGIGIDPNANSIHKFNILQKYRQTHRFGNLRYNDIPAYMPSPIGFLGYEPLDRKCPETRAIFNYITNLYHNNLKKDSKRKLIAIFSYHTTGGELYSIPSDKAKKEQINFHLQTSEIYKKYTNYYIVEDKLKYGFMDYFRDYLDGVFSITVELLKNSGNPLSCFTNINNFNNEIIANKIAIFKTLEKLI